MGQAVNFQELEVWQKAHQLVLAVYRVTKTFPADEKYGLVTQMQRAAVSVPANIAEGFKRRGQADKMHFYNTSETSLEELKYYFMAQLGFKELPQRHEAEAVVLREQSSAS